MGKTERDSAPQTIVFNTLNKLLLKSCELAKTKLHIQKHLCFTFFNICINYLLHYLLFSVLVNLSPDHEDMTFSSLSLDPLMEFLSYSGVALAPHGLNVLRCIRPSGKGHLWSCVMSQQYVHCLELVGVLLLLSKSIRELDGCESDGLPADPREPGMPPSSLSGSSSKYSISADI